MSDVAFETDRNTSTEFGFQPQTEEQRADTGELSMEELDEANGGMLLAVMAFMAGYGAVSMYYDRRGR